MTLPDIVKNVPKKIINKIDPDRANLYRIIPHGEASNPKRLLVVVEHGVSGNAKRATEGKYREVVGSNIFVDAEITREEMDEALEKYYP